MKKNDKNLADLNKNSIMEIAKNLSLENSTNFKSSSKMLAIGTSSERLLDLCKKSGCDVYLTGHGALNYLDHNLLSVIQSKSFILNMNLHHTKLLFVTIRLM